MVAMAAAIQSAALCCSPATTSSRQSGAAGSSGGTLLRGVSAGRSVGLVSRHRQLRRQRVCRCAAETSEGAEPAAKEASAPSSSTASKDAAASSSEAASPSSTASKDAPASSSEAASPSDAAPEEAPPKKPTFTMKKGQIVRVDREKYLNSVEYFAVDHPEYFRGLDYIYEDRGEILDIRFFEAGEYALISWAGIPTSPAWLPTYMLIKADKLSYKRM